MKLPKDKLEQNKKKISKIGIHKRDALKNKQKYRIRYKIEEKAEQHYEKGQDSKEERVRPQTEEERGRRRKTEKDTTYEEDTVDKTPSLTTN